MPKFIEEEEEEYEIEMNHGEEHPVKWETVGVIQLKKENGFRELCHQLINEYVKLVS